ncbi:hypothetical protein [Cystobacter ferrugineus]|uniref:hypothetical protein n=1 Tax=Cystobacter ferrugineus TaxID=83449 RepID=UPI000A7298C3|nr:hypothetical protein [Cystobacter ferrugineus]
MGGETFGTSVDHRTPSFGFERVLFDLHYTHYGGLLLKGLYAPLARGLARATTYSRR